MNQKVCHKLLILNHWRQLYLAHAQQTHCTAYPQFRLLNPHLGAVRCLLKEEPNKVSQDNNYRFRDLKASL